MNRREILKGGLYTGALGLIPFSKALSQSKNNIANKDTSSVAGFKKLRSGDLDLFILTDGFIHDKDVELFSPRGNINELRKILQDNFRPTDSIEMALNVLLVKTKDRLILFDTGWGIFAAETNGYLPESLAKAEFSVNDITDVFISHAHPDHIGGVVNKQNQLVFPNADIYISKIEYDFWLQATLKDFNNSALKNMPDFLNSFIPVVQKILTIIKPKLNFYDFGTNLFGHFNFQLAPGHTPGLTLTTISSNNDQLIYVADLIHSDVILFPHPEWGFFGDTDLDIAIASRKKVLHALSESRTRALAYHLPWPGLGFVKKNSNAFEWVAESFATP